MRPRIPLALPIRSESSVAQRPKLRKTTADQECDKRSEAGWLPKCDEVATVQWTALPSRT
jgi:hypothetical protein